MSMGHRTTAELEGFLDDVRSSPTDDGRVELIVRRPGLGQREVLDIARLTCSDGVEGDTWKLRGSRRTADGSSHRDMQLNVMNARFARFIAVDPDRMALAGDQLYVDFDLSEENAPAGTRLQLGSAVIEVTAQPHTGCPKFRERFGADVMRFANSPVGRSLKLRGINAKVVIEGTVRAGDGLHKVADVVSSDQAVSGQRRAPAAGAR